MPPPRLRHLCIVVPALAPAVDALRHHFGLEVAYCDPLIERWGVENAMLPVGGGGFIEVRAPMRPDAPAHRFLARRPQGGGYILAMSCGDLAERRAQLARRSVRLVNELDLPGFRSLHMHPRDSGVCMLELNATEGEGTEAGPYAPAGVDWLRASRSDEVCGLAAVEIRAFAPERLAAHWAELLQVPVDRNPRGQPELRLQGGSVRFAPVGDGHGEGVAAVELRAAAGRSNFAIVCIANVSFQALPAS